MNRWPVAAFGTLVVATVAAFFVTQALKVTTPLIQGAPSPAPAAFDPIYGVHGAGEPLACQVVRNGVLQPLDYRQTYVTFYLQHQPDHVAVYIVDSAGNIVRTVASDYDFRRIDQRNPPSAFVWNGREDSGEIAPDGTYYYRVVFLGQGRTIQIYKPIAIVTTPPRPRVVRVVALAGGSDRPVHGPALIAPITPGTGASVPAGTGASAAPSAVTIHYAGASGIDNEITVLRTDLPGGPRQVFSFPIHRRRASTITWNGLIHGQPAPAGTYLIGLRITDAACHVGTFPAENPPVAGTTADAGVTVRYLAAEVPNTPVPAGANATVYVDSRRHAYRWVLRRVGHTRALAHGISDSFALGVPLPASGPATYYLTLAYGTHRTVVPLIASAPASAKPHAIIVVLPALTWQGLNPVDDDGDGLPNTLSTGGPIALARPLVGGLPSDFYDEAALLGVLDRAGFRYDLTTDLGLLADPTLLRDHRGVVLAGSERWLPAALRSQLRTFAQGGGHVLALGTDSLRRGVTISGGQALDPTAPAATDAFGARRGTLVTGNHSLVITDTDPLGIFSTSAGVFSGATTFEPIQPPEGVSASIAGVTPQQPAIAGFPLGRGAVVEVGLDDFGRLAALSTDFRAVLARAWRLLGS